MTHLQPPAPSKVERTTRRLRERIASGHYAPGQALSRRTVASELGISPDTVHTALLRLAAEGMVHKLPGRSAYVPHPHVTPPTPPISYRRRPNSA